MKQDQVEIYTDRCIRKASERYECPVLQTSCYLVSTEVLAPASAGEAEQALKPLGLELPEALQQEWTRAPGKLWTKDALLIPPRLCFSLWFSKELFHWHNWWLRHWRRPLVKVIGSREGIYALLLFPPSLPAISWYRAIQKKISI